MSSFEKPSPFDLDVDRFKLLAQVLPKLPLMARVAFLHVLHISPPSKYVDLKTALTVAVIRSFLTPSRPVSISAIQTIVNRVPGIKGRIWVAKYTAPVPDESSLSNVVLRSIESQSPSPPSPAFSSLDAVEWPHVVVPVEAEWTGYRAAATTQSRLPPISEADKYLEMMKEVQSSVTILYLHGGAYYLMDPATHRPTTKKLAKMTKGRCYSVRYRLAPQHPFPAALIDALLSYLTLLYPPEDAFHDPVKPENIVFSGDSAGGNLCMALTQLLLEFKRRDTKVPWFGNEVTVPLPAGLALSSPWMDLTHSSPSCRNNAPFDYLPTLQVPDKVPRPPCPAWPARPPRKLLYCADVFITHPLASVINAQSWEGCPPVYMSCGWELLADEDKYMAAKLHSDKVPIVFEEYEAMPHCFPSVLAGTPMSNRCFKAWAGFIKDVVQQRTGGIESEMRTIQAKSLKEVDMDPATLSPYTEEELRERLDDVIRRQQGASSRPLGKEKVITAKL